MAREDFYIREKAMLEERTRVSEYIKQKKAEYSPEAYNEIISAIPLYIKAKKRIKRDMIAAGISVGVMLLFGILNHFVFKFTFAWVIAVLLFGLCYDLYTILCKDIFAGDKAVYDYFQAVEDEQYESERLDLDEKRLSYKGFLDGSEIDLSTVDYHLYSYTIDDEKEVIYMTKK